MRIGAGDAIIHSKRDQDRCCRHGRNDETPPTDTFGCTLLSAAFLRRTDAVRRSGVSRVAAAPVHVIDPGGDAFANATKFIRSKV